MYVSVHKFMDSGEMDRVFDNLDDATVWFDVNIEFFDYCDIFSPNGQLIRSL